MNTLYKGQYKQYSLRRTGECSIRVRVKHHTVDDVNNAVRRQYVRRHDLNLVGSSDGNIRARGVGNEIVTLTTCRYKSSPVRYFGRVN